MTERSYDVMRRAMQEQLPRYADVNEQHKFAIEWLYQQHDEVLKRLEALERAHEYGPPLVIDNLQLAGSGWGEALADSLAITGPDTIGPADESTPERMKVAPAGVYAGDGHPALRAAYEPEDHEPEPESEAT